MEQVGAKSAGIDLILEQGLNVRVVAFPDGEDPDSFARSRTPEELADFLSTRAQDFIQFKASLLQEETRNDPVKRAELIRDIVASISKIPNNIQKEVYVQECARIMDISESVLFNELAQILKGLNRDARTSVSQRTPFTGVKKETKEQEKVNPMLLLERKIIEILLLYGNEEVEFVDFTSEIDEEGRKRMVREQYSNTVSSEIYMHLHEDEIEFTDPVFLKIYYEIIHLLNQDEKISAELFTNHKDPEIASAVSDLLMDDEKYELSNWEKHNIFVNGKEHHLSKLVTDVLYNLRRILIAEKINELKSGFESQDPHATDVEAGRETLEAIRDYTSLKQLLFEKLNRVL